MEISLEDLAKFLVKAKKAGYASGSKEAINEHGLKQIIYEEGDYQYIDTFSGKYSGFGNEFVYLSGKPIWCMNFGWELTSYWEFVKDDPEEIFAFLRRQLSKVEESYPFRGPVNMDLSNKEIYRYAIELTPKPSSYPFLDRHNLARFSGKEQILRKAVQSWQQWQAVYRGEFFGGLIKSK